MWVLKVKVITLLWPKVMYIQKFKPDFLRNYFAALNPILYESFQGEGNENLILWRRIVVHSPIFQTKDIPHNYAGFQWLSFEGRSKISTSTR